MWLQRNQLFSCNMAKLLNSQLKTLLSLCIALAASISLTSCDDETGTLGISTMPSYDQSRTSQAIYNVLTRSVAADSLAAFTSDCYLGRVSDPETNSTTTCNFIAQFAVLEDDILPDISAMYKEDGQVVADSVVLNLYIKTYYGDSVNSMKIGVYELDSANVIPEGRYIYTNIDPEDYLSDSPSAVKKETTFAVADFAVADTVRFASSYTKNIRISLPAEYGTRILRLYYEHPEYFRNSYAFIHHVVPGFYFKVLGGNGTMVDIDITTLSIFFRFNIADKTYVGVKRVASTSEVIQCNYFDNRNLQPLMEAEGYTFVKSPVAIFTEATLPIESIMHNHENDSINGAKLVLPRYNNGSSSTYALPTPSKLLMVRKSELHKFFEQRQVPDNRTSYVADVSSTNNSYTFTNIAPLVAKMYKDSNTSDPDWNKVILLPVKTSTNSSGKIIALDNDLSMASVKLMGGPDNPIGITIIYSSFSD